MPALTRNQLRALHHELGIPANYGEVRHLRWQRETRALVSIGRAADDGQILRLTPEAAKRWKIMRRCADDDGVDLLPLSGFRSAARQVEIIRAKLAAGQTIAEILQLVAAPGYSEHHSGRALDIGSPNNLTLARSFEHTCEFRWLKKHAQNFAFFLSYPRRNRHGIAYEPWHWSCIP
ncbi:MAG: vanYB [Verrucomicrobia bacterium]|nr:vanYB [Verrucomicrobiota bacterium]